MALTQVTYSMINGSVVDVQDFGAVDDTTTNNTAAITAAAAHLQALGGGLLLFPFTNTGIYRVEPAIGTIIADFTDLEGVTVCFQGTTLKDTQTYPSSGNENTAFRFTRCNRVRIDARIESELIVTAPFPTARGLVALRFVDQCVDVDINIIMVGGKNAVWFERNPATQNKAYNIRAMIDASNCLYPYAGTFSGDDAKVQMRADTCGRNFFIYGVENNWIDVHGRNQMISSLIDNSGGGPTAIGCRNIWVNYYDRDSTTAGGAALIELVYRVAATTYENINVNLDIYCPATRPFDIGFRLVNVGGITGNTLDGLRISGRSEHSNALSLGTAHVAQNFNWDATDTVRNILIENFTGTGTNTSFGINLQALEGPTATFVNVSSETTLGATNGTVGSVTFVGCTAAGASNSTDIHTYVNCNWIDTGSQNKTNKTFVSTFVGTDKLTSANSLGLTDNAAAPATIPGIASLFVDVADGDLKVRFGDGTIKTIVVDT
jgi:hypothetical protein